MGIDGSAIVEMGLTTVLCLVSGPHEPASRAVAQTCRDRALVGSGGSNLTAMTAAAQGDAEPGFVNVTIASDLSATGGNSGGRTSSSALGAAADAGQAGSGSTNAAAGGGGGGQDKRTQELVVHLTSLLHAHLLLHRIPRSQVDVSLRILSDDGSSLAALVNAAVLALVDAGIPMRGLVCAASCGLALLPRPSSLVARMGASNAVSRRGGGLGGNNSTLSLLSGAATPVPLLDLTKDEAKALPYLTIATEPANEGILLLLMENRMPLTGTAAKGGAASRAKTSARSGRTEGAGEGEGERGDVMQLDPADDEEGGDFATAAYSGDGGGGAFAKVLLAAVDGCRQVRQSMEAVCRDAGRAHRDRLASAGRHANNTATAAAAGAGRSGAGDEAMGDVGYVA